jgi:hypothetical protein
VYFVKKGALNIVLYLGVQINFCFYSEYLFSGFCEIRYKALHIMLSIFEFRTAFRKVKNALVGYIYYVTEYAICIVVYIHVRCGAT